MNTRKPAVSLYLSISGPTSIVGHLHMYVHVVRQANYIQWRIQRPDRFNALGPTIGQQLRQNLDQLQTVVGSDPSLAALFITAEAVTSKNQVIWIAGGDLKELAGQLTKAQGRAYGKLYQDLCTDIAALPIPVITSIDGLAIGGGVEFALASDIRIASDRSEFHFKQTEIGLPTGFGGTARLQRLVGSSLASSWLLEAKKLSASEALRFGLVSQVVAHQDLAATGTALLDSLASRSQEAIRAQKRMLVAASHGQSPTELDLFTECWGNDKHRKFLTRFSQ